jgi:hypothetical protein
VARFLLSEQGPPWSFACLHSFCGKCMEKIVVRRQTCPLCAVRAVAWRAETSRGSGRVGRIIDAMDAAVAALEVQVAAGVAEEEEEVEAPRGRELRLHEQQEDPAYGCERAHAAIELRVVLQGRTELRARTTRMAKAAAKREREAELEREEDDAAAAVAAAMEAEARTRGISVQACWAAYARAAVVDSGWKPREGMLPPGGMLCGRVLKGETGTTAVMAPWARVTRVVRGQAGELAVRREVAARGVASGRVSGI